MFKAVCILDLVGWYIILGVRRAGGDDVELVLDVIDNASRFYS